MMLIWKKPIGEDKWIKVEKMVNQILIMEQQSSYAPDADGGFSDIFFLDEFAIKYTSFWDYDELTDEDSRIDLELHSDAELIEAAGDCPFVPKLFAQSTDGCFVIMERMFGTNLEDHVNQGGTWTAKIENDCIAFVTSVINCGWFPFDFNFRCIYPFEKGGLKVIDFNMYQEISYLKDRDYQEYDLTLPAKELARQVVGNMKEIEMDSINRNQKHFI